MLISTRNKNLKVDSKRAIIEGLASDGGLYLFEEIKRLENLESLLNLNYQDLAFKIIGHLFNDLDLKELRKIIDEAYGDNFDNQEITPLKKVDDVYFLQLYHGPTSAFKDVALQFLPRIMKSLKNDERNIVILTATSGDTGKAALEGFKNHEGIKIIVLYPYKMVSMIQERQMLTTSGNNVEVIAVKGNFDDCQKMVKEIFAEYKEDNIHLSSANSINIARLVPQIVYYFKAYFDLIRNKEIIYGDKIDFIVPTGNFGDILAGYLAKLMGLPINKLVIASNKNNVLTQFFKTGIYDARRPLYNTMSPSIDILISSNLERLLYLVSQDDMLVKKLMQDLKEKSYFEIDKNLLDKLQASFEGYDAKQQECQKAIKECFDKNYLIDPHTAVAYVAYQKRNSKNKQVILETASAYKFSKDVYKSLTNLQIEDNLEAMDILNKYTSKDIPKNLAALKDLKVNFDLIIDKHDKSYLINKLKEF